MLPASTVPKSGQVLVVPHCRVSSMTYALHLNMRRRQMVPRGLVYPLRVSWLTYTAPAFTMQNLVSQLYRKVGVLLRPPTLHSGGSRLGHENRPPDKVPGSY